MGFCLVGLIYSYDYVVFFIVIFWGEFVLEFYYEIVKNDIIVDCEGYG